MLDFKCSFPLSKNHKIKERKEISIHVCSIKLIPLKKLNKQFESYIYQLKINISSLLNHSENHNNVKGYFDKNHRIKCYFCGPQSNSKKLFDFPMFIQLNFYHIMM